MSSSSSNSAPSSSPSTPDQASSPPNPTQASLPQNPTQATSPLPDTAQASSPPNPTQASLPQNPTQATSPLPDTAQASLPPNPAQAVPLPTPDQSSPSSSPAQGTPERKTFLWSISLFESLTLLIQILGFGAAVITLLFLGQQVKDQSTATESQVKALQSSTYQGLLDKQLDLDKIFIEQPELRPYIFENKRVQRGDKYYDKVIALADYQLDFFEMIWSQKDFLPELQNPEGKAWKSWEGYMKSTFEDNFVLCDRLKEAQGSYHKDFVDLVFRENGWCPQK